MHSNMYVFEYICRYGLTQEEIDNIVIPTLSQDELSSVLIHTGEATSERQSNVTRLK